jgi:hypothetical protein
VDVAAQALTPPSAGFKTVDPNSSIDACGFAVGKSGRWWILGIPSFVRMDPARNLYAQLNTAEDILALKGKEEDLFLEVKQAAAPMSEDDKIHLSEALSGFANSAGGVVIFGLVAKKDRQGDVISKPHPIKNLDLFVPEVQSLIGKAVVPLVDGVLVKVIRYADNPSYGFVVILIPESDRGPHRAMLKGTHKQYYKRSGDSFYVMEHFDLADMFGKRRKPDLRFRWRLGFISYGDGKPYKFAIIVGLENVGRGIARYPLFAIRQMFGAAIFEYGVDGNRQHGLPMLSGDRPGNVTFAGGVNNVVHPGTIMEVTALGFFDVSTLPDIKLTLTLAAEDLEAQTQEIEIKGETVKNVLDDPVKRGDWVPVSGSN